MDVLDFGYQFQGWKDRTKALKTEFQRQCLANEQFFVTEPPPVDPSAFLEDPDNESTFLITGMKASAIVNLLRCLIIQCRHKSGGPFYFKFADDKKFKLELIPTDAKPGNGLLKVVGRMKYTTYPEMSGMLRKAGVTSKGLGDMIFKLNTQGMKSAFYNAISPMNELHFMMLFEVARRLVRGGDGQPISTEPEDEKMPYGVIMARIIKLLQTEENGHFAYEDLFNVQGKYNCFTDPNIIKRKQKINALNVAFFEKIVKPLSSENEAMEIFLQSQKNSVVIKTTQGYLQELREAFGEVEI